MNKIEINIENALENYNSKNLKIIDIRTLKEWKMTGIIPNSFLVNMHNEDFSENLDFIKQVEDIINNNQDIDIAFICASGARSEIAAQYFIDKEYTNIFHIPLGILGKEKDGWLYLGYPIESFNEEVRNEN
jgi:rhodanese-related sulfurtransferase